MRIKFTKRCCGREPGTVEDQPDNVLAKAWIDAGVAEAVEPDPPKPVEDRAMGSPPRGRKRKRS